MACNPTKKKSEASEIDRALTWTDGNPMEIRSWLCQCGEDVLRGWKEALACLLSSDCPEDQRQPCAQCPSGLKDLMDWLLRLRNSEILPLISKKSERASANSILPESHRVPPKFISIQLLVAESELLTTEFLHTLQLMASWVVTQYDSYSKGPQECSLETDVPPEDSQKAPKISAQPVFGWVPVAVAAYPCSTDWQSNWADQVGEITHCDTTDKDDKDPSRCDIDSMSLFRGVGCSEFCVQDITQDWGTFKVRRTRKFYGCDVMSDEANTRNTLDNSDRNVPGIDVLPQNIADQLFLLALKFHAENQKAAAQFGDPRGNIVEQISQDEAQRPLDWQVGFGGSFDGVHYGHALALISATRLALGVHETVRGLKRAQSMTERPSCSLIAVGVVDDSVIRNKPDSWLCQSLELRRRIVMQCFGYGLKLMNYTLEAVDCHRGGDDAPSFVFGLFDELEEGLSRSRSQVVDLYNNYDTELTVWKKGNHRVVIATTPLGADGVGIAGSLRLLDRLVLTPEVIGGGKIVNETRALRYGFKPLPIIVVPLVPHPETLSPVGIPELRFTTLQMKTSSRNERELLSHFWTRRLPQFERRAKLVSLIEQLVQVINLNAVKDSDTNDSFWAKGLYRDNRDLSQKQACPVSRPGPFPPIRDWLRNVVIPVWMSLHVCGSPDQADSSSTKPPGLHGWGPKADTVIEQGEVLLKLLQASAPITSNSDTQAPQLKEIMRMLQQAQDLLALGVAPAHID